MFRNRGPRNAVALLGITLGSVVGAPALASARPANPIVAEQGSVDVRAFLASTVTAMASIPVQDVAGPVNPNAALLALARVFLAGVPLPPQGRVTLERVITFLDGSGGGGPKVPSTDAPVIAQFLYPTIGKGCVSPTADSVGSAFAVPGPAALPLPGPQAGQAAFICTALGTAPLAKVQPAPFTVTWINIDNGRRATQDLTGAAKINPDGPATVSATADTGRGRVFAVVSGSLTTQAASAESKPSTCSFVPTVGMLTVA